MAIRPIDMQTNMSQVTEVGKDAQARMDAVVGQQHGLEKESGEKARLVNTKLDEAKKGESATIRDQQKKGERRNEGNPGGEAGEEKKKARTGRSKDSRMGNIIDILK
ncbi:MAG: hypothetical protein KA369_18065 [Spirochaetes bacterium]|nr:hypothetical protein [Spirochaetota bacterium]